MGAGRSHPAALAWVNFYGGWYFKKPTLIVLVLFFSKTSNIVFQRYRFLFFFHLVEMVKVYSCWFSHFQNLKYHPFCDVQFRSSDHLIISAL